MLKLLRRNAAFIYFSFVVTGLTTVGPQRLFAGASGNAEAWVAATLLVGTLASLAGVSLADRIGLPFTPALGAALMIVAITVTLLGSYTVKVFTAAAFLQIAARFLANYTKQAFDHRGVELAGSDDRVTNDRVAVMMRFMGMVLGPLWFGAFELSSPLMLCALFVLMLMSLSSVGALMQPPVRPKPLAPPAATLPFQERLFVIVAIGIYGEYYLLAANIVYVLDRAKDSAHASSFAGVLVTIVYATAMAATIVVLRLADRNFGLLWMAPAPVLMFVFGLCLNSSVMAMPILTIPASMALGIAFAFYLLAVRNRVTSRLGSGAGLAFFNNLGNTSALAGFSLMAVLVAISHLLGWSYSTLLAAGLCALALATIAGIAGFGFTTGPPYAASALSPDS